MSPRDVEAAYDRFLDREIEEAMGRDEDVEEIEGDDAPDPITPQGLLFSVLAAEGFVACVIIAGELARVAGA